MLAMASILRCLALSFMVLPFSCQALVLGGVEVPHARDSRVSRAFNEPVRPSAWPYSSRDLTPDDPSNDQLFYLLPKFVHHAAAESRAALKDYYQCVLPETKGGAVLDLCSSFTSHYPKGWRPPPDGKCVCLGLNPLELAANPSKSEWRVQNLNTDPILPYADGEFDLITNSLSVDYLTKPLEAFQEIHRVLKPGGLACMAFTNRCFPSKVVPIWKQPFSDLNHARIVGNYFHFSAEWESIDAVDVSPEGWAGQRDPMFVIQARKRRFDV